MGMKIEIVSKETIKPSSPTPDHLRSYKLSILDQIAPRFYVPIILFYPATGQNSSKIISNHLKNSLATTLTHFYPLAGRVKNGLHIDCNDDGATFIEAHVAGDMSVALKHPDIDNLQRLLPCKPTKELQLGIQELLIVQVNYFTCGGMAVGLCIDHVIADASSIASFLKSWAADACGFDVPQNVIFDYTSFFPPVDSLNISWKCPVDNESATHNVTKRFVFKDSKITALRQRLRNWTYEKRLTRCEAVSGLMSGALIAAIKSRDKNVRKFAVVSAVNLRNRMTPPLPEQCIGNLWRPTTAIFSTENVTNYDDLAGKIRESIDKANDGLSGADEMLKIVKFRAQKPAKRPDFQAATFVSWCRFPFYEADFGWGRPIWVTTTMRPDFGAFFLDTSDGDGIEMWLGLPKDNMEFLEQNPEFLEYALYNPSI